MLAEDRTRAIVELVRTDGFQAIDTLALQFGVTPQTIRRDVNLLCDRGLLRRRHPRPAAKQLDTHTTSSGPERDNDQPSAFAEEKGHKQTQ